MVRARVNNVKSGWKSVFVVLTYAGKNSSPQLVRAAFALVTTIHKDMWNHIAAADAGAGQRHGTETIDEVSTDPDPHHHPLLCRLLCGVV